MVHLPWQRGQQLRQLPLALPQLLAPAVLVDVRRALVICRGETSKGDVRDQTERAREAAPRT
jgi:hypothetical protein